MADPKGSRFAAFASELQGSRFAAFASELQGSRFAAFASELQGSRFAAFASELQGSRFAAFASESNSEEATRVLAAEIAQELAGGDVVALVGPLGAGKTAFVRGLAEGLGLAVDERVSSPSYTLVNEYALRETVRGASLLVHLDLYRIAGDDALEALGFGDFGEHMIVVIEWPEHAPGALAAATLRIDIEDMGGDSRRISVTTSRSGPGPGL